MPTDTITVQSILPPKPGGKMNVLVDSNGEKYYVFADKVANYQIGSVYDVTYKMSQFGTRNVDSAVRSNAAPQAPRPQQAATSSHVTFGRETSVADRVGMFVHGWVTEGVASGQVQATKEAGVLAVMDALSILVETESARQKCIAILSGQVAPRQVQQEAAPPPPPPLNDAIPF